MFRATLVGMRALIPTSGRLEEASVNDERGRVRAEAAGVEAVGTVERHPRVAEPRGPPGGAGGEELRVSGLRRPAVRGDHVQQG